MAQNQVVTILESLANGVDPTTGASAHDVFATPDVIRALFIAAGQLRGEPPIASRKSQPAAAGQRWTDDEDAVVCCEFDHGVALSEIATRHGRTKGAITSRLVKLGRTDPESVKVRDRGVAM
ncbi:MAG TPA: hypothetical protein VGQ76_13510 [Thermoanaerobaculia bacterium]|jgi:hypothetical protein|nr:hypothetical protein [Thermoanaerobaculia bacterium]